MKAVTSAQPSLRAANEINGRISVPSEGSGGLTPVTPADDSATAATSAAAQTVLRGHSGGAAMTDVLVRTMDRFAGEQG